MILSPLREPVVPKLSGDPNPPTRFYVPALDGLRVLAFLGIFAFHLLPFVPRVDKSPTLHALVSVGMYGVSLFFVLSAFLITRLLLAERERTGTVDLRAYYVRRTLRIWPLYFLVSAVGLALAHHFGLPNAKGSILPLVTFTANFAQGKGHLTTLLAPLWSLSIEEQFYLVWPLVLSRASRRGLTRLCAAMVAVAFLSRILITWHTGSWSFVYTATTSHLDSLAFGTILALQADRLPKFSCLTGTSLLLLCGAGLFAVNLAGLAFDNPVFLSAIFSIVPFLCAVIVASGINSVGTFLALPRLAAMGKLTFGLYMWHVMLIFLLDPRGLAQILVCLALSIAAATLTYYGVERPFLRLKTRFERVQTRTASSPTGMSLPASPEPERTSLGPRRNNFGALRLLFAALVVVAHAPEMIDGDQHREILHRLLGTNTFGGLALSAFFIISGFLIVKSWCAEPKLGPFLAKRVLRIVPGFAVAVVLSLVVVQLFAAAGPVPLRAQTILAAKDVLLLREPSSLAPLRFAHLPIVNGSMWTIKWEFACYLVVAAAGVLGLARRPAFWAAVLLLALAAPYALGTRLAAAPAGLVNLVLFLPLFASGALFFLLRDRIVYTRPLALAAALGFVLMYRHPVTVGLAGPTFGAYLLFTAAFAEIPRIGHIGTRNDVSYGLYLYAWPIQQLLLLFVPGMNLAIYTVLSLVCACAAGFLSWRLVESPAMGLKSLFATRRSRPTTTLSRLTTSFSPSLGEMRN